MKRILLCAVLCCVASGTTFAQLAENPFIYVDANDQLQACQGIASRNASYCNAVSDFNDRQICAGLAASSQDPCRTMTDRNLQLTCYGMAFAPNFPSNCRDITDPGLQDFCYSVSSWGAVANCSGVSLPANQALCLALTHRTSSYCATITNDADRRFCEAVSTHDSSSCGGVAPSLSAGGPYTVPEGGSVTVAASGAAAGASYAWDLDDDGSFETSGQSATFSAAALDGPATRQISVQATAGGGQPATAQATVSILNVPPSATFEAPGTASPGGTFSLSLTAPVDVEADLPMLEYAFDCGGGYGSFSTASTTTCPVPGGTIAVVRGKVQDKDGGVQEYSASVVISTPTVPPDPFPAPARNDSTFVVDRAGCSTSGPRSLTITLPVNRVVGKPSYLVTNGLLARVAVLRMAAYDIHFSGGGSNPDRVYFNGHLIPMDSLTGTGGIWKVSTFPIPVEWVDFRPDPVADPLSDLTPKPNTLQIELGAGNTSALSCTSVDWTSLNISVARPVLLVHGILSNHETWEKWVQNLGLLGLPVDAIDVGKLGSIQDNAAKIRNRVDKLRSLWGVDRINIGCHSKGGLDSRDYVEGHDTVAALTQIGTPNAGSPLASLIQKGIFKIPVVGGILVGIVDLLFPAAYQLTPEYMSLYNSFHGHNSKTVYTSLAGDYRFGGLLGKIPNYILSRFYDGPSDLVVPVWSVHALRYARHLVYQSKGGNHQAWHTSETKSPDIYNILIPFFRAPSSVLPSSSSLTSTAAPALDQPILRAADALDDADLVLSTKTIVGTILQGETKTETLYMDGTQPISLMIYHGTGELRLALISPSGVRIDPATAADDPGVDFEKLVDEEGLHVLAYGIETPEPGLWTLEVSAPSVVNPSGQEPYFLTGLLIDPSVRLTVATERSIYYRGDPMIIRADFRNGSAPIPGAQVTAQVVDPDQNVATLALSDDGTGDDQAAHDGVYTGRFSATATAGLYQVLVDGTGPEAQPFTREELLLVPVSASTSRFNGQLGDAGEDTDADGLFNDLVVEVGMEVTEPRSFRMLGELADANGDLIATATATAELNAGAATIALRFDGASIYEHGVDGPYLLRVVRVAEEDGAAILPLDERSNAHTTASYDHRQFQHPALAALDQSVATDEDAPVDLTLRAEGADPSTLGFNILSAPSHGVLGGTAPHLTYTPQADFNGTDVFTFNVSDGTVDSGPATVLVTVNPVNDPPALVPVADLVIDEGTTVQTAVSASDPDGDDLQLVLSGAPAFAVFTDHGDGTGTIAWAPGFAAAGTYHLTVAVSDGSSSGTTPFTLVVNNVNRPPVARIEGPSPVQEGDRVTFDASRSADPDADGAIARYEWDLDDDGAYDDAVGATASRIFEDQGTYLVGLRVTDDLGAQATATAQVAVLNVAPAIGAISAPAAPSAVNVAVSVSATFSDPGVRDTHTAVWDWNDGTTSAGAILAAGSGWQVTGTHTYTVAGVYTVRLTVADQDGGTSSAQYQYLVIYDPNGSFVTGGGWLISPAGADPAHPALTGQVNFGFVSKYKSGGSLPTGQTEFQFQVANLSFHSTAYEWLVVAGARAQYKGSGEINGTGGYDFLVTVIDGQISGGGVDRLRMKIWERASSRIVYDNQLGAADDATPSAGLQGGAIVIHR